MKELSLREVLNEDCTDDRTENKLKMLIDQSLYALACGGKPIAF